MSFATALGLVAATLTSLAFLPQVIKTWRSQSAADLSAGSFGTFFVGVVLWLVYGVLVDDLPVIVANTVTLAMAGAILVMKVVFDRREASPSPDSATP